MLVHPRDLAWTPSSGHFNAAVGYHGNYKGRGLNEAAPRCWVSEFWGAGEGDRHVQGGSEVSGSCLLFPRAREGEDEAESWETASGLGDLNHPAWQIYSKTVEPCLGPLSPGR